MHRAQLAYQPQPSSCPEHKALHSLHGHVERQLRAQQVTLFQDGNDLLSIANDVACKLQN